MDWPDLAQALLLTREHAAEIERAAGSGSTDGRRAALVSIEANLLLVIMRAPWVVRLPLIGAAALVRIARG
jgi:hypothetical protein